MLRTRLMQSHPAQKHVEIARRSGGKAMNRVPRHIDKLDAEDVPRLAPQMHRACCA